MALRSGYYGLKNSVKRTLEKLASDMSGAKIIKTIGDGLSLSAQGALAANIDTDTMEFKDHKLAAKIPVINTYSKDTLYTSDVYADAIPFTFPEGSDLDDYDQIMIIYGGISDKMVLVYTINVDDLKVYGAYTAGTFALTNPHLFLLVYVNDTLRVTLNSDNTGLIVQQRSGTTTCIRKVIGVKF